MYVKENHTEPSAQAYPNMCLIKVTNDWST